MSNDMNTNLLMAIEEFLFNLEFNEDPQIEPFYIKMCDIKFRYKCEYVFGKWRIITY